MSLFKQVEGAAAIVVDGGISRQVEVFTRDGVLYAKVSGGFVKLMADGATSKASGKMRLDFISIEDPLHRTATGVLCLGDAKGAKPLQAPERMRLTHDV